MSALSPRHCLRYCRHLHQCQRQKELSLRVCIRVCVCLRKSSEAEEIFLNRLSLCAFAFFSSKLKRGSVEIVREREEGGGEGEIRGIQEAYLASSVYFEALACSGFPRIYE